MLTESQKPKMGRPKLAKGHAKGVIIAARFSDSESKEIDQAINRDGIPKPDWVRKSLLSSARRGNLKP
jgi:hypothetical protein